MVAVDDGHGPIAFMWQLILALYCCINLVQTHNVPGVHLLELLPIL